MRFLAIMTLSFAMLCVSKAEEPADASTPDSPEKQGWGGKMREHPQDMTPEERQQIRGFMEKTREMTPEQRHEALENLDPELREKLRKRFKRHQREMPQEWLGQSDSPTHGESMNPEAEAHRKALRERFEKLTPEEKQRLQEFRQKAREMTPEQRGEAIRQLPLFKDMPPDQQKFLQKRLQRLQQMSPEQKQKTLQNFEQWKKMSPDEREKFRRQFKNRQKHRQAPGSEKSPSTFPPADGG